MGEYSEAVNYFAHSLEITEAVFGKTHPTTAISYSQLGRIHEKLGDLERAIDYQLRSYNISLNRGEEGNTLLSNECKLGDLYLNLGDYAKALEFFRKSFQKSLLYCGQKQLETANLLDSISLAEARLGNVKKSLQTH